MISLSSLLLCSLLWTVANDPAPAVVDDDPATFDIAVLGDVHFDSEQYGRWLVERVGIEHVRDYVVEQLVLREAEERGLMPTDEEVEAARQEELTVILREYYRDDIARYETDLKLGGEDPTNHADRRRREIRPMLAMGNLARADREYSEAQVRKRYEDIYGQMEEQTTLEVLFLSMYRDVVPGEAPDMTALKASALARANLAETAMRSGTPIEELLERGDKVNSDFVHDGVIKLYRQRLLGKEVDRAVSNLDNPGDVTEPIAVFDGYYVVRLVSREAVSFERVEDELKAMLHETPASSSEIGAIHDRMLQRSGVRIILN